MHMKSGKITAASFFLLIKVLINLAHEGTEEEFDQMLSEAIALGVDLTTYLLITRNMSPISHLINLVTHLLC